MRCCRGTVRLLAGCMAVGFLGLSVGRLQAVERCQAFVDGLRKREFYDAALDYLEFMRTSPLVDRVFAEAIDYEIGVTLVESARVLPLVDREKRLNEARNAFQKFIAGHPLHWLAIDARAHLGNLLVDRGRLKMELGTRFKHTPEEKKQAATEARTLYQDAQQLFAIIDAELSEKLKEYKTVDGNDSRRLSERDQLRSDSMQARLALASIVHEIARTYDPGSQDNKDNLLAAATKFGELFKKYSRWVGGYYARIEEARCYQELGDAPKAITVLGEVMAKKDYDEGFHRVRSSATVLALQTALLPQVKQYKEAIEIYRNWETNIAERAESSEEALAIKCLSGEAALEYARSVKVDSLQAVKERSDLLQMARDLLIFVTRFPGEYRRRARVKLADPLLGGNKWLVETAHSYDEARDRAKIAWDQLREQDLKPEEEAPLRTEALQNFRFALLRAPAGTSVEDLNSIRYSLAYLYWGVKEDYDAAVLSEFLARRYPNRPEAQQAAKLTLAAYARLLGDTPSADDRKVEKERMTNIARFITERWPNSPAADEAWTMLIRLAISDRDLDKMAEYLGHVSVESPRRGETELLTGQTLWTAYLNAMRLPEAKRPSKAELAKIFAQAQKALADGVGRLRKPADAGGQVSPLLAAAVLSLAQVCLEGGQPQKAVAWFDDPNIGPHTLVDMNHPATDHGNFCEETLKATLRAYVAAKKLEHLDSTMNALEATEGDLNLTQIYRNLGRQLEESLKQARVKNDPEEVAKLVRGFASVLTRLATRPVKEANFNTLNWTAEMFAGLATSADTDGNRKPPAEAADFYKKAVQTYGTIVEACGRDEKYAPQPEAVYGVQIRLARCLRRLGQYEQAVDALVEVLKVRVNLLEPQREAAYTYQAWGEEKSDAYLLAIKGGQPVEQKDGSKVCLIWGWGGIARRVQANEARQAVFHEARYNVALCRFKYAEAKSGQDRTNLLNQARRDIMYVYRLYPDMGGKERRDQYDGLMRRIERLQGVSEEGLKEFDGKPPG